MKHRARSVLSLACHAFSAWAGFFFLPKWKVYVVVSLGNPLWLVLFLALYVAAVALVVCPFAFLLLRPAGAAARIQRWLPLLELSVAFGMIVIWFFRPRFELY